MLWLFFLLPSSFITTIENMIHSCGGHNGLNNRDIHWMSWKKLSMHENLGDMDFKDFTTLILAMLGKQSW